MKVSLSHKSQGSSEKTSGIGPGSLEHILTALGFGIFIGLLALQYYQYVTFQVPAYDGNSVTKYSDRFWSDPQTWRILPWVMKGMQDTIGLYGVMLVQWLGVGGVLHTCHHILMGRGTSKRLRIVLCMAAVVNPFFHLLWSSPDGSVFILWALLMVYEYTVQGQNKAANMSLLFLLMLREDTWLYGTLLSIIFFQMNMRRNALKILTCSVLFFVTTRLWYFALQERTGTMGVFETIQHFWNMKSFFAYPSNDFFTGLLALDAWLLMASVFFLFLCSRMFFVVIVPIDLWCGFIQNTQESGISVGIGPSLAFIFLASLPIISPWKSSDTLVFQWFVLAKNFFNNLMVKGRIFSRLWFIVPSLFMFGIYHQMSFNTSSPWPYVTSLVQQRYWGRHQQIFQMIREVRRTLKGEKDALVLSQRKYQSYLGFSGPIISVERQTTGVLSQKISPDFIFLDIKGVGQGASPPSELNHFLYHDPKYQLLYHEDGCYFYRKKG